MAGSDLFADIRSYLAKQDKGKDKIEAERRRQKSEESRLVGIIVEFFSHEEILELLRRTDGEITIFSHYSSSLGAAMTGGGPDYEVAVNKEGLIERNRGENPRVYPFPPTVEAWRDGIPYGELFHDSSSGDYRFTPLPELFMSHLEAQARKLLK